MPAKSLWSHSQSAAWKILPPVRTSQGVSVASQSSWLPNRPATANTRSAFPSWLSSPLTVYTTALRLSLRASLRYETIPLMSLATPPRLQSRSCLSHLRGTVVLVRGVRPFCYSETSGGTLPRETIGAAFGSPLSTSEG